jgi:hypothetical protein
MRETRKGRADELGKPGHMSESRPVCCARQGREDALGKVGQMREATPVSSSMQRQAEARSSSDARGKAG